MKIDRPILVAFADEKVKEAFEKIKKEDSELHKFISRAIDDIKAKILFVVYTYQKD